MKFNAWLPQSSADALAEQAKTQNFAYIGIHFYTNKLETVVSVGNSG